MNTKVIERFFKIEKEDYDQPVIYCILNTLDNKMYIGKTFNYRIRAKSHRRYFERGDHSNIFMQRVYNKYPNVFKIFPIETCLKENLFNREEFWVRILQTENEKYGYNLQPGGKTMCRKLTHPDAETRKKISDRLKKRKDFRLTYIVTEKTKYLMSIARKNYLKNNPFKNCIPVRVLDLETKENLGEYPGLKYIDNKFNIAIKTIQAKSSKAGKM